jgi:hypothetical protein
MSPALRTGYGATVLSILGLAVAAGCGGGGDDDKKKTASSTGGFDSPYCVTARKWAAHELDGEAQAVYARAGRPALKKYMRQYVAYTEASARQAPPAIRQAAAIKDRAIRTRLIPVLEKYGYDPQRLEAEGSASEQAIVKGPGPKAEKAQEITHAYDDRVCQYGGPPRAANVTFKASAAAKRYCEAVAAQEKGFEKVVSSRFTAEALRSYSTSDSFKKALDAQVATAPAEIAADVKADTEWDRTRKVEVLEDYDYDLRRLLLEGSEADLAVFNYWDPAIRKQDSRVTAYQEQVCGA